MDLTGRYVKVLEDSAKKHYPCIKGDYMLFDHQKEGLEWWGERDKRSNYWGSKVSQNPDFQLMPVGFHPENINPQYEIY